MMRAARSRHAPVVELVDALDSKPHFNLSVPKKSLIFNNLFTINPLHSPYTVVDFSPDFAYAYACVGHP